MKTTKMLAFLIVALGMVCSKAEISEAAPMGAAWTYQGRLMDANGPADGLYDLQFTLYDDANTIIGNKIGSSANWPDVDVIDGYFTVVLDFNDPNAFMGESRWLEVVVRPGDSNNANDFVALVPRQEVTPTPYALYARTAGNALTGSGTTNRIAKFIGPNSLGDSALYEHNYYVGVGTTNPRGMFDVDCDGGDIYLDTFSSKIYIGDVDGDGDETLFTVDDSYGKFTFENGKVGIGTTTPVSLLEVISPVNTHAIRAITNYIPVYGHRTSATGTWPAVAGDCNSLASGASGIRGRILSTSPGDLSAGVYGYNSGTGSNGVGVRGHHSGSGAGVHGTAIGSAGTGVYGQATYSGNATNVGVHGLAAGSSGRGVQGRATGNKGMGVYGEATDSGNTVVNYGGYFKAAGKYGRAVYAEGTGDSGWGVFGETSGKYGIGVEGVAAGQESYGVYGLTFGTSGKAVVGLADATKGDVEINYGGYFKANGPAGRAVYGEASNSSQSARTYGGYFRADSESGIAVYGMAGYSGSVTNYGGYFTAEGGHGIGVYGTVWGDDAKGVYGRATGANGIGVYGRATSVDGVGVRGRVTGANGVGVHGYAVLDTGIGVLGEGGTYNFYAVNGTYGSGSSIRWKRDIQPIDDPLVKVSALRGVYFNWDAEHGGKHAIGMIAEEVGQVLPEIVSYEENGIDAKGMDYSKLAPLLVEAVKAQQKQIQDLQKEVAGLKNMAMKTIEWK